MRSVSAWKRRPGESQLLRVEFGYEAKVSGPRFLGEDEIERVSQDVVTPHNDKMGLGEDKTKKDPSYVRSMFIAGFVG